MPGREPDDGGDDDPRDPPSDDADDFPRGEADDFPRDDADDSPRDDAEDSSVDEHGDPAGDDAGGSPEGDAREPVSDDWPGDWTTAADAREADTGDEAPDPTDGDDETESSGDDKPGSIDTDGANESTRTDDFGPEDASSAVDDADSSPEDATVVGADRGRTHERAGEPAKPPAPAVDDSGPTIAEDGVWTWFRTSNHGAVVVVRDIVSSVGTVVAIGLVLFAISGIWPPLVAVESGSMEPHMHKGDLVFIVDETRYAPQSAVADTGVSTYQSAQDANGYWKFGNHGDVVVYKPSGGGGTPIIHRARFHVEEGENWIDDADPAFLGGVDECHEVPRNMCPAPYDGFVTKGDANPTYDQIGDQSTIVKSEWIRGKAAVRIPLLGWIRLQFAELALASVSASSQALGGALGLLTRTTAFAVGVGGILGVGRFGGRWRP